MSALAVLGRCNSLVIFASYNLLGYACRKTRFARINCSNTSNNFITFSDRQNPPNQSNLFLYFKRMSSSLLNAIPIAEIDPDGTFKYILVKVYGPQTPDGTEPSKLIVRGNKRGPYHADIYDETVKMITEMKLDSECIGGGKIQHNSAEKKINIYGSSQGFGKADHEVTAQILKQAFPGYEITWNDDGN